MRLSKQLKAPTKICPLSYLNPLNLVSYFYSSEEPTPPNENPLENSWVWQASRIGPSISFNCDSEVNPKDATIIVQKTIRAWNVQNTYDEIRKAKEDRQKTVLHYKPKIKELNQDLTYASTQRTELESEMNGVGTDLKEFGFTIASWFSATPPKSEEDSSDLSPRDQLELKIAKLDKKITKLQKSRAKIKRKQHRKLKVIDLKIDELFSHILPPPPLLTNEDTKVSTPYSLMLEDLSKHTHDDVARLMQVIFDKAEDDVVEHWTFDPSSNDGEFKITLKETVKLWVQPQSDDGEIDPRTPRGVVFIIGDPNQTEVRGQIKSDPPSIHFERGFNLFCHYSINAYVTCFEGIADGKVNFIEYDKAEKTLAIATSNTARALNSTLDATESTKINTLKKTWSKGKILTGCHEAYLEQLG